MHVAGFSGFSYETNSNLGTGLNQSCLQKYQLKQFSQFYFKVGFRIKNVKDDLFT